MLTLYQKAIANLPLTPGQRALLKVVQSLLINVVTAILALFSGVLISNQPIHFNSLLLASVIVAGSTVLHGIAKLMSASSDPQLQVAGTVTEKVADGIDTRYANIEQYDAKGPDPTSQDTLKTQSFSVGGTGMTLPTTVIPSVPSGQV